MDVVIRLNANYINDMTILLILCELDKVIKTKSSHSLFG